MKKLKRLGATIMEVKREIQMIPPNMWIFQLLVDNTHGIVLMRNAQFRFTEREMFAVNEWVESDWLFHTIRDLDIHANHLLVQGLWGAKLLLKSQKLERDLLTAVFKAYDHVHPAVLEATGVKDGLEYSDEAMHALFEDLIDPVVDANILYHDSVNCTTGDSDNEIRLLQSFEKSNDSFKHPTLESDGLIGEAYTWNMVRKPSKHAAWTKCQEP